MEEDGFMTDVDDISNTVFLLGHQYSWKEEEALLLSSHDSCPVSCVDGTVLACTVKKEQEYKIGNEMSGADADTFKGTQIKVETNEHMYGRFKTEIHRLLTNGSTPDLKKNRFFDKEVCEVTLSTGSEIREHMLTCIKTVHKRKSPDKQHQKCICFSVDKSLPCGKCGKLLSAEFNSRIHQVVYSVNGGSCEICERFFKTKQALSNHQKSHTKGKWQCEECGKAYRAEYRSRHQLTHCEFKPYSCDICQKEYKRKDSLTEHQHIHSGNKNFQCDQCGKFYWKKYRLKAHQNNVHKLKSSNGDVIFSCDTCKKSYKTKGSLKDHQKIHVGDKKFQCDQCHKAFLRNSDLNKHKMAHTSDKRLFCKICNQKFTRISGVKRHEMAHKGDKPYRCNICDKSFTRQHLLEGHKRFHVDVQCDICTEHFTTKAGLRMHKLFHLNIDLFICASCGKPFRDASQLKQHEVIHGDKNFFCDVCGKGFKSQGSFKRHGILHYDSSA